MILKNELNGILLKYGHDVYLRRRLSATGSGPYMEVAGGRYSPTVEAWTSYRMLKGGALQNADEGYLTECDAVFYFQAEAALATSDLIIEDSPHERTKREVYRVRRAVPYYFGRELIYFAALCDRITPLV